MKDEFDYHATFTFFKALSTKSNKLFIFFGSPGVT